jgi:hypothetical protein
MLYGRSEMAFNAGNRKDVREAEKRQKTWDQQQREHIAEVMSTTIGRRWMCDLLEHCHVFATSFRLNGLGMAFNEGQREVGLRLILAINEACPDQYVTMMRERNERSTSRTDGDGSDSGSGPDDSPGGDDTADEYLDYTVFSR